MWLAAGGGGGEGKGMLTLVFLESKAAESGFSQSLLLPGYLAYALYFAWCLPTLTNGCGQRFNLAK